VTEIKGYNVSHFIQESGSNVESGKPPRGRDHYSWLLEPVLPFKM